MNKKLIKQLVDDLRSQHHLTLPVDVERLAEAIGAEVRPYKNMEESLSGFAYQRHGSQIIGVNELELPERKRFTVAHELGHLFLHKQEAVNYDRASLGVMLFRDDRSSRGTNKKEVEANSFAAELLMPEDNVREEVAKSGGIDLEDEEALLTLAEKYGVSRTAMTVRLTSLYLAHQ